MLSHLCPSIISPAPLEKCSHAYYLPLIYLRTHPLKRYHYMVQICCFINSKKSFCDVKSMLWWVGATHVMLGCTTVNCPRPSEVTHVALIYNVPDGVFRQKHTTLPSPIERIIHGARPSGDFLVYIIYYIL